MNYETIIAEIKNANVRYRVTRLSKSRIVIVPTLLNDELVWFIAWIEGNRKELYRFLKRFSYHGKIIYRDRKALWQKRSVKLDTNLYQFKGF